MGNKIASVSSRKSFKKINKLLDNYNFCLSEVMIKLISFRLYFNCCTFQLIELMYFDYWFILIAISVMYWNNTAFLVPAVNSDKSDQSRQVRGHHFWHKSEITLSLKPCHLVNPSMLPVAPYHSPTTSSSLVWLLMQG